MKSALLHEGVGASRVVLPAGRWSTVLEFLAERFPGITAAEWRSRMERGRVLDETGSALDPGSAYLVGARVQYYRELPVFRGGESGIR